VLSAACDDAENTAVTSPSAFKNELDIVSVVPSLGHDGSLAHCPSLAPFSFPFILNVTAGTRPLTLAEVRIQPTNPFGRTEPPTIFDSSSLTRRFGSVTVASFAVRQFPFTHNFSCSTRGGMLDVSVTTTDGTGRNRVSTQQVPVN
jgi:hypothetical protein